MGKVVNGTDYGDATDEVIQALEAARQARFRVHISLGYTTEAAASAGVGNKVVGQDWLEEFHCTGYVGRSCGPKKVPLLVHNSRSLGGMGILLDCVVRIRKAAGGQVLYQHPKYHHGKIELRRLVPSLVLSDGRALTVEVLRDGQPQARFANAKQAERYIRKLGLHVATGGDAPAKVRSDL